MCQYMHNQSEKMLCDEWDANVASQVFIQNMMNVLRATSYQKLKMVDLVSEYIDNTWMFYFYMIMMCTYFLEQ